MQVNRYGDMFSKNIKEGHGQSLVTRKSETLFQCKVVDAVTERHMQNSTERKNSGKRHPDIILTKKVEGLMSKASNERMESHVFQSDDIFVNADCDKENLSCEENFIKGYHVLNDWCKHVGFEVNKYGQFSKGSTEIDEDCNTIYDDEYFSKEDNFELLQQKNFIHVFLDGGQVQHVDQRNKA